MPNEESIEDTGLYVSSTNVWDISSFFTGELTQDQLRELFVRLYQNINNISTALNLKDSGYYDLTEFNCGQQFFPNPAQTELTANPEPLYRSVYRSVYNFGALPNTATKTMPHNLPLSTTTSTYTFTHIYGAASVPNSAGIPLPYTGTSTVELWIDATNINIKTSADFSAYTTTYIILEYLKQ